MNQKRLAEFDALIGNYYGQSGKCGLETDPRKRVQELLSTYYGNPAVQTPGRGQSPGVSLSLGCDDGEVLSQPPQSSKCPRSAAYSPTAAQATSLDFEEYVIDSCDAAGPSAYSPAAERPAPRGAPQPPVESATPPTPASAPSSPTSPVASSASLSAAEADIVNDIQSIIRGQKVYEKERGLVDRSTAASMDDATGRNAPYAGVSNQPKSGHEIFDRIAQSMQFANAYDLGTVPLENRFAEFDRQEDQRRNAARKKSSAMPPAAAMPQPSSQPTPAPDYARATTADFVNDLDAIKSRAKKQPYSRPFYDTGEHVIAGGSKYPEMLRAGKGLSVHLSYGQVIAMGDLYDTPDDLLEADPDELNRLKTLIVRQTAFYEGRKANKSLDVDDPQWNKATGGRYLKLAEENYEHFSPPSVAMGSGLRMAHGDNRSQWEKYHKEAIEDAQQEFLAKGPNMSILYERALVINAFADHFLTDAFAAGHLINKEAMIDRFRAAFFSGNDLSSAGEKFFERVADTAWTGKVAAEFSKLETVEFPKVHAPWWAALVPIGWPVGPIIAGHDVPVPFHPNIDSASRFASVLKGVAKEAPTRVGNVVVKALHGYLNDHGIEVTNAAGDGTWLLPGDGSLMVGAGSLTPANLAKNLEIMRKAVQQSIDDINDPSIMQSNLNFQKYFDGVWKYVPQLTSASQTRMTALIREYSDPNSSTLVKAAADIVSRQVDSLIDLLKEAKKLQPA